MSIPTYFVQACPTCGRHLQVRLELLGREVLCKHCHAQFHAKDPSVSGTSGVSTSVTERANELLALLEHVSPVQSHSHL